MYSSLVMTANLLSMYVDDDLGVFVLLCNIPALSPDIHEVSNDM